MQSQHTADPISMLSGPSLDLAGHQIKGKGSSQPIKYARSINGYLPIERFTVTDDALMR
jgi:hypothetical protein